MTTETRSDHTTGTVDPEVVRPLLDHLRHGGAEERLQAAAQLSRLHIRTPRRATNCGSLTRSAVSPYPPELYGEAMASVRAALSHESPAVRREAITALGEIGDEQAVEILSAIASGDRQDPDEPTRGAAFTALGTLGGPTAVRVLYRAAEHDLSEANQYDALVALNSLILSEQSTMVASRGLRSRGAAASAPVDVRPDVQPIIDSLQRLSEKADGKEYLRRIARAMCEEIDLLT